MNFFIFSYFISEFSVKDGYNLAVNEKYGLIFVSCTLSDCIKVFNLDGKFVVDINGIDKPTGVASWDDYLAVGSAGLHRVLLYKINSDKSFSLVNTLGKTGFPCYINPVESYWISDRYIILLNREKCRVEKYVVDEEKGLVEIYSKKVKGHPIGLYILDKNKLSLMVMDSSEHEVYFYRDSGKTLKYTGFAKREGNAVGYYFLPRNMDMKDGLLFVADSQRDYIEVLDVLKAVKGQLEGRTCWYENLRAWGGCLRGKDIFFGDVNKGQIVKVLGNGECEFLFKVGFPRDVYVDFSGGIWVCDLSQREVFKAHRVEDKWEIISLENVEWEAPYSIDGDRAGRIYVLDAGLEKVRIFDEGVFIFDPVIFPQTFVPGGIYPSTKLSFSVFEKVNLHAFVVNQQGNVVKEISEGDFGAGKLTFEWDGKDDSGSFVPEGDYFICVSVSDKSGNSNFYQFKVTAVYPANVSISCEPNGLSPNGDGRFDSLKIKVEFDKPTMLGVEIRKPDGTLLRTLEDRSRVFEGTYAEFTWDGRDEAGDILTDGCYIVSVIPWHMRGMPGEGVTEEIYIDTSPPVVDNASSDLWIAGGEKPCSVHLSEAAKLTLKAGGKVLYSSDDFVSGWVDFSVKDIELSEGLYEVEYEAEDLFGNRATGKKVRLFGSDTVVKLLVDKTPPVLQEVKADSWFYSPNGDGVKDSVHFEIILNDLTDCRCWLKYGGKEIELEGSDNKFSYEFSDKIDDSVDIFVRAVDTAGNVLEKKLGKVICDLIPPKVVLASFSKQVIENFGDSVDITVEFDEEVEGCFVFADETGSPVFVSNNFSGTEFNYLWNATNSDGKYVPSGRYYVWLSVYDKAGNASYLKLDKQIEVFPGFVGTAGGFVYSSDGRARVFFPAGCVDEPVKFSLERCECDSADGFSCTAYAYRLEPFMEFNKEIKFYFRYSPDVTDDRAGIYMDGKFYREVEDEWLVFKSLKSGIFVICVDDVPPQPPMFFEVEAAPIVEIKGTCEPSCSVNLSQNFDGKQVAVFKVKADSSGNFIFKGVSLESGENVFYGWAEDQFGNCSQKVEFSVEYYGASEFYLEGICDVYVSPNGDGVKDIFKRSFTLSKTGKLLIRFPLSHVFEYNCTAGFPTEVEWEGVGELENGVYEYSAEIYDSLGNYKKYTANVIIDRIPPLAIFEPLEIESIYGGDIEFEVELSDENFEHAEVYFKTDLSGWKKIDYWEHPGKFTFVFDSLAWGVDGNCWLKVVCYDTAGNVSEVTKFLKVDNSGAVAYFVYPYPNAYLSGIVELKGFVKDATFAGYAFEIGKGSSPESWERLAEGEDSGEIGFSFNTTDYEDGVYCLRLLAWDKGGNVVEDRCVVEIDNTLPKIEVDYPSSLECFRESAAIKAVAKDKNLTSFTLEYFKGEIDVSVEEPSGILLADSFPAGETASILQNWNVGLVPDGKYTLIFKAKDKAGNLSIYTFPIIVDNTPPAFCFVSPSQDQIVGGIVSVKGVLIEENVKVIRFLYADETEEFKKIDEVEYAAFEDGSFVKWDTTELSDGIYKLKVEVEDKAGNYFETEIEIELDNTIPQLTLDSPVDGSLVSGNVDFIGSVYDKNFDRCELYFGKGVDPSTWSEIGTVFNPVHDGLIFSGISTFEDGDFVFKLIAYDKAGNKNEQFVKLKVDNRPPLINVDYPVDGAVVSGVVELKGTACDYGYSADGFSHYEVYIYQSGQWIKIWGSSFPVFADKLFDLNSLIYPDGELRLKLVAYDVAGHTAEKEISFVVDNTAPFLQIIQPSSGDTVQKELVLKGHIEDEHEFNYSVYIAKIDSEEWIKLGEGSGTSINGEILRASLDGILAGEYRLKVEATDAAANVSIVEFPVKIENELEILNVHADRLYVSPNNDGVDDEIKIFYTLTKLADVTVKIYKKPKEFKYRWKAKGDGLLYPYQDFSYQVSACDYYKPPWRGTVTVKVNGVEYWNDYKSGDWIITECHDWSPLEKKKWTREHSKKLASGYKMCTFYAPDPSLLGMALEFFVGWLMPDIRIAIIVDAIFGTDITRLGNPFWCNVYDYKSWMDGEYAKVKYRIVAHIAPGIFGGYYKLEAKKGRSRSVSGQTVKNVTIYRNPLTLSLDVSNLDVNPGGKRDYKFNYSVHASSGASVVVNSSGWFDKNSKSVKGIKLTLSNPNPLEQLAFSNALNGKACKIEEYISPTVQNIISQTSSEGVPGSYYSDPNYFDVNSQNHYYTVSLSENTVNLLGNGLRAYLVDSTGNEIEFGPDGVLTTRDPDAYLKVLYDGEGESWNTAEDDSPLIDENGFLEWPLPSENAFDIPYTHDGSPVYFEISSTGYSPPSNVEINNWEVKEFYDSGDACDYLSHSVEILYDEKGRAKNARLAFWVKPEMCIKTVQYMNPTPTGENFFVWDGKDESGNPVEDGEYVFVIFANGSVVKHVGLVTVKTPPEILGASVDNEFFSPNGDGVKDTTEVSFSVSEDCSAVVKIVDSNMQEVVELFSGNLTANTVYSYTWDGKANGAVASDGEYYFSIVTEDSDGNICQKNLKVVLDTNNFKGNVEGLDLIQITTGGEAKQYPVELSDKNIAFCDNSAIYLLNKEKAELSKLVGASGVCGIDGSADFVVYSADGDIYKTSIQTGVTQNLTSSDNKEIMPLLGPAGRYIYYLSGGDIWRMNVDGTSKEKIVDMPEDIICYSVFSYGIIFATSSATYLCGPDGTSREKLLDKSYNWLTAHPAGNVFAGVRDGKILLIEGNEEKELLADENLSIISACFSVDGTSLYFEMNGDIWQKFLYTGNLTAVISFPTGGAAVDGLLSVHGSACDLNFENYSVEIEDAATSSLCYSYTGIAPVYKGTLAALNTLDFSDGEYLLRLCVTDKAGNQKSVEVNFYIENSTPEFSMDSMDKLIEGGVNLLPRLSPDDSELVFSSNRDGDFDIYVMDLSSKELCNLTESSSDFDGYPCWSPDGRYIAFVRKQSGVYDIWAVDRTTGDEIQITSDSYVERELDWSPDGKKIVFVSNASGNRELWEVELVYSEEGKLVGAKDPVKLTSYGKYVAHPVFSPDGKFIAFSMDQGSGEDIYILDLDTKNSWRITSSVASDSEPSWNSAGDLIVFTSNRDEIPSLWITNTDTIDNAKKLTKGLSKPVASAYWSKASNKIAFVVSEGFDTSIYLTTLSSIGDVTLFANKVTSPVLLRPATGEVVKTNRPDFEWSSSGAGVVYELEYARSPDFADSVLISGLTSTSYQIPVGSELEDGVWYWRVRALKGAVASQWSETGWFEVRVELNIEEVVNYPNPFKANTVVRYILTKDAEVAVRIFTLTGRLVREFRFSKGVEGGKRGVNEITWDGRNQVGDQVANGVYLLVVEAHCSREKVKAYRRIARLR